MNIFAKTNRPQRELFFERRDRFEQSLGQVVRSDPGAYARAQTVLLGCPQDMGVLRNAGRGGAAQAPTEIRRAFYRFPALSGLAAAPLFDLGDVIISSTLEATHETLASVVEQVVLDGKRVLVLGGGNDISYPDCRALANVFPHPLAFNIDSHFDVRASEQRSSGTPYRQLLEEQIIPAANLVQIGMKPLANAEVYRQYVQEKGVRIFWFEQARERGLQPLLQDVLASTTAEAIFWGFDMDAVRSADAPGVSAGFATGFTAEEMCAMATTAGRDRRSRIFEISEVSPPHDVGNQTSKLAAMLLLHFLEASLSS